MEPISGKRVEEESEGTFCVKERGIEIEVGDCRYATSPCSGRFLMFFFLVGKKGGHYTDEVTSNSRAMAGSRDSGTSL